LEAMDSRDATSATDIADILTDIGAIKDDIAFLASEDRIFIPMELSHTVVAVQHASTTVLAANADRRYVLLVNASDEDMFIKFGAIAVENEGIRINKSGGAYELNGIIDRRAVTAICASGGKNLLVTEGVYVAV